MIKSSLSGNVLVEERGALFCELKDFAVESAGLIEEEGLCMTGLSSVNVGE